MGTEATLSPGTRLGGRYVLERFVRPGGLADVYRARAEGGGMARYELRLVRASGVTRDAAEEVARELERVAQLGVKHIPKVVTVAHDPAGLVVVSEGPDAGASWETLREILTAGERLNNLQIERVLDATAASLDALHGLAPSVIHRAICPENLALTDRRVMIRVDECGLSHALHAAKIVSTRSPATAKSYVSPDELLQRLGPRGDLFAFASVIYELLTGRAAFRGASDAATETQILRGARPGLGGLRNDLSQRVDDILHQAWSTDNTGSFGSARALVKQLQEAMSAPATPRPPMSNPPPPPPSALRPSADRPLPKPPSTLKGPGPMKVPGVLQGDTPVKVPSEGRHALGATQKVIVPRIAPPGTERVSDPAMERLSDPALARVVDAGAPRSEGAAEPVMAVNTGVPTPPSTPRAEGEINPLRGGTFLGNPPPSSAPVVKVGTKTEGPLKMGPPTAPRRPGPPASPVGSPAAVSPAEGVTVAPAPAEGVTEAPAPAEGVTEAPASPAPAESPVARETFDLDLDEPAEASFADSTQDIDPEPELNPSPAPPLPGSTPPPPMPRAEAKAPETDTDDVPEMSEGDGPIEVDLPVAPEVPRGIEVPIPVFPQPVRTSFPPPVATTQPPAGVALSASMMPPPMPAPPVPRELPAPRIAPAVAALATERPPPPTPPSPGEPTVVRVAKVLGVAIVLGALIVTAGQIYLRQTPPAVPTPRSVVAAQTPTPTPPPTVAPEAPPRTPESPAPGLATPDAAPALAAAADAGVPDAPAVAEAPVDAGASPEAPAANPAANPETPAATPPSAVAEGPVRHGSPSSREEDQLYQRVAPAVFRCIDANPHRRRCRVSLAYEGATGRNVEVRVSGVYSAPPTGPCIEQVLRESSVGRFSDPRWETLMVFDPEDR
ncbi:MAG: protein kinase [Myxococcales bacterium]|nr:protein kinase [Myxococcales bacterium]